VVVRLPEVGLTREYNCCMAIGVFVSYRRTDRRDVAGRLKDRLAKTFGQQNIFFDVDSVDFGLDFRTVIRETMASISVVVLVIGPRFETERLHQANDVVRMELKEAMAQRKLIVPVLVDGAIMPRPEEFPSELASIGFINAAPLRPDPDFGRDATRIVEGILRTSLYNAGKARGFDIIRFPDGSTGAV
jgi:TIR domain